MGESINISQTRINFRKIIFGKGIFNELTRSSPSTFYLFFSIKAWISLSLIRAPTNLSFSKILLILRRFLIIFKPWPFFKNTTVGIALIPNSIAISSNSSTSILSKSVSGSFLTTLTENFSLRQLLKSLVRFFFTREVSIRPMTFRNFDHLIILRNRNDWAWSDHFCENDLFPTGSCLKGLTALNWGAEMTVYYKLKTIRPHIPIFSLRNSFIGHEKKSEKVIQKVPEKLFE